MLKIGTNFKRDKEKYIFYLTQLQNKTKNKLTDIEIQIMYVLEFNVNYKNKWHDITTLRLFQ